MAADSPPPVSPKLTDAKVYRHWEKQLFQRFMVGVLAGSGVLHGLTIGLVYLRPTSVKTVPPTEPEMEIVIEDDTLIEPEVTEEVKVDDIATTSGSSGGDESLQVATLAPPQETIAEPAPTEEPSPEITDADLTETPPPNPKPKKSPQAEAPKNNSSEPTTLDKSKEITKGPTDQAGEKNGDPNASKERGLSKTTGKGTGTGNQTNNNGGDGPQGKGTTNDGGADKTTTPKPTPTPSPTPKATPKPIASPQVAIVPSPKPPEPIKQQPKSKPKSNYGYERKEGERIATGTKARFTIEYDENGKVKGGKLAGSTGDAELDAAQLRDFNRALESNKKLKQQLENRDPDKRDRPVRFVFDGDGESAAERAQIQRNRDLMAQQEAQRAADQAAQAEPPAQAAQPATPPAGGFVLPLPAPAIDLPPEPPATPPTTEALPAAEKPPEPIAPPLEAPPSEPADVSPIEAAPLPEPMNEAPVEAPVEAPPEPAYEPPVEELPPPEPTAPPVTEAPPVETAPPPEATSETP